MSEPAGPPPDRLPPGTARTIRVLPDAIAAARTAARAIVRCAGESIAERGRFVVALSGGSSPITMFEILAREFADAIGWHTVHIFWADERCVPPDDPGSNYGAAKAHLLAAVPVPQSNVHRIRGELTPPVAAGAYRAELAAFFGAATPVGAATFDLVLLGMGEDGHTASIFPGSPALDSAEWALDVQAPQGVAFAGRVTATAATIAASRQALLLVTGAAKAVAVGRALHPATVLPAGIVAARSAATWIIDEAAAAALDPA